MATTAATRAQQAKAQARPAVTFPRKRVEATYLIMLLPVVLLFTLFITVPALVGLFYSFTNYQGYGNWKFIGLTNYLALFSDPRILSPDRPLIMV
jgi:raffinose/stachyose/melibiose transport system permease protein